jgi:predicted alpha/beta-fold hydrolase
VGCLLQTPRTYNAANFEDLSEVVRHVKSIHPGIPLAATGVSMGGYVIIFFFNCIVHALGKSCSFFFTEQFSITLTLRSFLV